MKDLILLTLGVMIIITLSKGCNKWLDIQANRASYNNVERPKVDLKDEGNVFPVVQFTTSDGQRWIYEYREVCQYEEY